MCDLKNFVIPNVAAKWEDVAVALCFSKSEVEYIERIHGRAEQRCCRELFKDWLTTNNGAEPKTWKTLLDALNSIENFTPVAQEITDKLHHMD